LTLRSAATEVNAPLPSSDAPPAAVAPVPMMNLRRFIVLLFIQ
jgi:hypothetical protein